MSKDQKTLKQLKIFREIIAWMFMISFIGITVGLVTWIWFGNVGFKLLLTSVACVIFFGFWSNAMDKAIKKQEEKVIKEREVKENV